MMPWELSWRDMLRAIADADDVDPAALEAPAEVIDGGPWRGIGLERWLARFRRPGDPVPTSSPNPAAIPQARLVFDHGVQDYHRRELASRARLAELRDR